MQKRFFICSLLFCVMSAVFSKPASGEILKSDQFVITDPELDFGTEEIKDTVRDTFPLLKNSQEKTRFTEYGYIVRIIADPIISSIDNANIKPEKTVNNNGFEQTAELSVKHGIGRRTSLTVGQIDGLKSLSGSLIDGTRCDRVNDPCTRSHAKEWESEAAWGVGYSVDGRLYKPFPKLYQNEQEELILVKDRDEDTGTVSMKIRIRKSDTDRAETYQSIIQLTAGLLF